MLTLSTGRTYTVEQALILKQAALRVSLIPTVMQMSCTVWEPSDWFRWGTMVRKPEVFGSRWKSSGKVVGEARQSEVVGAEK